jgi:lysophospholipase L1-like esterase
MMNLPSSRFGKALSQKGTGMALRAMRGRVTFALACCLVLLAGLAVARPAPARADDGDVDWTKDLNGPGRVVVAPGSQVVSQSCDSPRWQVASTQAFAPSGSLAWRFTDQLKHSAFGGCYAAVDNRGNTYWVDHDATDTTGQPPYSITAIGSDGYIRWSTRVESPCEEHHRGVVKDLVVGTDGNVYATMYLNGTSCDGSTQFFIGLDASDGDYLFAEEFSGFTPDGNGLFAYDDGLAVVGQDKHVQYYDYAGDLQDDYTLPAASFYSYNLYSLYSAGSDGSVFVGSYYGPNSNCSSQNAVITKVTPSGGDVWTYSYTNSSTCTQLNALAALPNGGAAALSFPGYSSSDLGLRGLNSSGSSAWTKSVVADQSGDSIRWATNMYVDTAGTVVTVSHTQFNCNGGCDGVQIDRWDQDDGDTIGSAIVIEDTLSKPGSYYLSSSTDNNFVAIDSDRVYLSMTHCEGNNCQGGDPKLYAIEVGGLDPDYPSDPLIDAMPSTPFSPPSRQNLVVLADSVGSGEGINYGWFWNGSGWARTSSAEPGWEDSSISGQDCHLSFGSYPSLVASAEGLDLTTFACSGAKSVLGIMNKQEFDGHEADYPQLGKDATGYDDPNPAYDDAEPDYVALTVGANDIGFPGFLVACYLETSCDNPTNTALLAGYLDDAKDGLETVLTEIQDRGEALNPDHVPTVILTTYYDPFGTTYTNCADVPSGVLTQDEVTWLRDGLNTLNENISDVAADFSSMVQIVDLGSAFEGHELCASDPWVFGASIIGSDPDSPAPFHPTPRGQVEIAELIDQQVFNS